MGDWPVTTYEIDADLEIWIPVPRQFPDDVFTSAEEWADDLSEAAIPDDQAQRRIYRGLALEVAHNQLEEASHTFWYSPEDGHALGTASLSIFEEEPEINLSEVVRPEYESATPLQIETFESRTFGQVLQAASTISADPIIQDNVATAPVVGQVRTVGYSKGLLFILDAYDADLATLGFMMKPMLELFEAVTIFDDEDNEATE